MNKFMKGMDVLYKIISIKLLINEKFEKDAYGALENTKMTESSQAE